MSTPYYGPGLKERVADVVEDDELEGVKIGPGHEVVDDTPGAFSTTPDEPAEQGEGVGQ